MPTKILFIILILCFFNSIEALTRKINPIKKLATHDHEEPATKKSESSLAVGMPAPNFSLPDQDGKIHSLADYKGWKIALCFYPKDHTRGCIAQMCSLRTGWDKLKAKGITVLGINFDSQAMHAQFAKDQRLNFPLLSDVEKEIGKAYKVTKWYSPNPERITYIIDEKGNIFSIIKNVNTKQHAEQILEHVNANPQPITNPEAPAK